MSKKIKGSCLCGEVSYQFSGEPLVFQYCHCSRCQKITGSAHASNLFVKPENFSWQKGESYLKRFDLTSAKYFSTSFCEKCGASMPWLSRSGKAVIVPAGSLDNDPKIKPKQNIYYGNKAKWYLCVDDLPKFDGSPV